MIFLLVHDCGQIIKQRNKTKYNAFLENMYTTTDDYVYVVKHLKFVLLK